MTTHRILSSLLIALTFATTAACADRIAAGPKGGRLLDATPHQAEFFVNQDRRVEIDFYDTALKPVSPGAHVVAVTAEPANGRTKLDLEPTAAGFRSRQPLPAGEPYRVVIQIRSSPDAKPHNFRVDLNLAPCGECRHAEYACTCEGH